MKAHWLLIQTGPDEHEVLCRGRSVASGMSEQQALKLIRRRHRTGQSVVRQEPDGYRVDVSKTV